MHIADLIRSRGDGSISLTKCAALAAHIGLAAAFFRFQVFAEAAEFNMDLWLVYGGFAIAHAGFDKTAALIKDTKDRQLEVERDQS
jgi:hypothetical protein